MKLIDQIIELLSTEKGSLTDALLKTKVLLHSLGQTELIAWVNSELNGYHDDQDIPDYRKVPAQVLANLASMTFQANSHPLPIGHLSDKQRENLESSNLTQSLAVLEKFSENPDGSLSSPIPLEYNGLLGKHLANGVSIQRAWSQVEVSSIIQILTEVRSRLLDFVLNLKDQLPEDSSPQDRQAIDTKALFNNAILGDNATIIIGDKNKADIVNFYLKGNLAALEHELKKFNVADNDISSLKQAIQDDESEIDETKREFGSSVNQWVQNMSHKAVDTSWQIELGMASSVLVDALKHYYGW
ncbi:MAG: response regulator receiver protein [Gammaproteobacteria bacterium]